MKALIVIMVIMIVFIFAIFSSNSDSAGNCGDMTIVASGETVSEIADRCNVTSDSILALNPGITDPNKLSPGMVLHLPVNSSPVTLSQSSSADQDTVALIPVTGATAAPFPTAYPLPGSNSPQPVPAQASPSGGSSQNLPIINYTVQPGDTLASIAARYNTTVQSIMALNPTIEDPNVIHPGEILRVQDP